MEKLDKRSVEYAIDQVRPQFNVDGGDIHLVSVNEEDNSIVITLTGACFGCGLSEMHVGHMVESHLKRFLPELGEVTLKQ